VNLVHSPWASGEDALAVTRGVCRLFRELGYATLIEFKLASGRRADVAGLDRGGRFAIAEVKSSLADFRADDKWHEYLPFCDFFYFAVAPAFPCRALPEGVGVIVADAYEGTIAREAPPFPVHPTRRRAQVLRFALLGAERLNGILDPLP
jgi:hypothetical protein